MTALTIIIKVTLNLLLILSDDIYMISSEDVISSLSTWPVRNIFTDPPTGTCGETAQTIQTSNSDKYQCQYGCPSMNRTYPKNQKETISKIYLINSSRTFQNDRCMKIGSSQNLAVGQLLSGENCYIYDKVITAYERSTHALWIKPKLGGAKGTVLSIREEGCNINNFSLGIENNKLFFGYGFGKSYLYSNSYIPDYKWTHLAVQVNYRNGYSAECSIFINGKFLPPRTDLILRAPFRKKRDAPVLPFNNTLLLSVGVTSDICSEEDQEVVTKVKVSEPVLLTTYPTLGYETHPEVTEGVAVTDPTVANETEPEGSGEVAVTDPPMAHETQPLVTKEVAVTDLSVAHETPLEVTESFIISIKNQNPVELFTTQAADVLVTNTEVVKQDEEYGIYKGEIKDYVMYSDILTNREIEALINPNMGLAKVTAPSDCLCPPDFPAISPSDDLICVQNSPLTNTTAHRLGSYYSHYHIPEYAIDGNLSTTWISIPEIDPVALDMRFNEPLQVLGVNITMNRPPPGQIDIYLMDVVSNEPNYHPVAVLTSNSTECNESYPVHKPYDTGCYVYKDILNQKDELLINLLQGRENWYNTTYMNTDLFHFLRGEGLRVRFQGFPSDNLTTVPSGKYQEVNEIGIISRKFSGNILCGCYAPGTDDKGKCDVSTSQCPCLTQFGDPSKAGLKCEPYVTSITPTFGPESGGSIVTIIGGYFDNSTGSPVIEGRSGDVVVEFAVIRSNEMEIIAKTVNVIPRRHLTLNKPLQLVIKLLNGHVIQTELFFTYMEDPTITDIYPLKTFLRGGIQQTVVGNNFQSAYRSLMTVSVKDAISEYPYIKKSTDCTIANNTIMMCPSPDFSQEIEEGMIKAFSKRQDMHYEANVDQLTNTDFSQEVEEGMIKALRKRRDMHYEANVDQLTNTEFTNINNRPVEYYIGFELDGMKRYENVSKELGPSKGTLQIFYDPVIEKWDNVLIFSPYKGEKVAYINGQKMDSGCNLQDYNVFVGSGQGDTVELISNQLVFKPPANPPDLGDYDRNGYHHRVVCTVGNIKATIGYIEYRKSPLDDPRISAGVIASCIVATVIVVLVVAFFAVWKYNGESLYQSLRKIITSPENRHGESHIYIEEAIPVFNQMEQLKIQNMTLYENIMKVRIDDKKLQVGEQIGKGNFGTVHNGIFSSPSEQMKVAIKTLKGASSSVREFEEFLDEATIMMDFDHENVLSLLGVVIMENKPYVVLPLMDLGDLRGYVANPENHCTVAELLRYGQQIAAGMTYLSVLKFVHRDLAARNCMINSDLVVKIADFGLARDIYEKDYYATEDHKRPLPVKWMAIECLNTSKFSTKSDVWSYAVTLWELLMRGIQPYPDIDNIYMKNALLMGKRLEQPAYCPDTVYKLMQDCWKVDPKERPDFEEIVNRLDTFFIEVTKFLDNEKSEASKYNMSKGIPEYLEMSVMNSGTNDDINNHGYLPVTMDTDVDIPTTAGRNINMDNKDRYGPSDRYSRDPTAKMEGSVNGDGYLKPVSMEVSL